VRKRVALTEWLTINGKGAGMTMATDTKVRLTVDVSKELNEMLEGIAKESGSTKSEVFRKAIALLDVAHRAKREGKRFGIAKQEQQLDTEIVGL
jgi:predicted transcriptional regulator